MSAPGNPSAFPVNCANDPSPGAYPAEPGMTMRDWFAGQAVTGILANSENTQAGAEPTNCALSCRPEEFSSWVAKASYLVADAMLAERAKSVDVPSAKDELLEAAMGALSFIESGKIYDLQCCGGGSECGCRGSTYADEATHFLRAAIAKSKGGAA